MKYNTTLLLILFFSFHSFSSVSQEQVRIDFQVDMKEVLAATNEDVLQVGISGSIEPLTWQSVAPMEDPDGDGIYTTQILFDKVSKNDTLQFKFRLNEVEWETGENRVLSFKSKKNSLSPFRYDPLPANPFARFIGEWKLKNDDWRAGSGKEVDSVKWYNHNSSCKQLHGVGSLLWSVETGSLKGNIFWVYNFEKGELVQSSCFTPTSTSLGNGKVDENGNITDLKVHFNGDENSYRVYSYTWLSDNEYFMNAKFYENGIPTGQFYEGFFVRKN